MINKLRTIFKFSQLSLPSFKDYKFSPKIMEVLDKKQIFTPSPIQDLFYSEIARNKFQNYVFIGPTGTGKTLGYVLPIVEQLKKDEEKAGKPLTEPQRIRSLILVPSKELVDQITDVFKDFAHNVKLRCLGLTSVNKIKNEEDDLTNEGVDVAVTTIDRLERHRQRNNIFVSKLKFLVIDEVDTLIDSGNEEALGNLCKVLLKAQRETQESFPKILLVGATCTNKFEGFINDIFGKDIKIVIEKNSHMHLENLSHEFIHCSTLDKKQPFLQLMKEISRKYQAMLVFCNTITSAQFLERVLIENKYQAVSLHGSVPRNIRVQNVQAFRSRSVKIMVATDLAARGLDFPFMTHVVNFDFPTTTSDYLHRAGRAGRAGRKGYIISLYHNKDEKIINELKQSNEQNVPLKIQGSSYSKINREVLERQKQLKSDEGLSAAQLEKINDKKNLKLPEGYLEAKQKFKKMDFSGSSSQRIRGYKPGRQRQRSSTDNQKRGSQKRR